MSWVQVGCSSTSIRTAQPALLSACVRGAIQRRPQSVCAASSPSPRPWATPVPVAPCRIPFTTHPSTALPVPGLPETLGGRRYLSQQHRSPLMFTTPPSCFRLSSGPVRLTSAADNPPAPAPSATHPRRPNPRGMTPPLLRSSYSYLACLAHCRAS